MRNCNGKAPASVGVGVATKSQSIIMGSRLVDIAKMSMIYRLYLAVKL